VPGRKLVGEPRPEAAMVRLEFEGCGEMQSDAVSRASGDGELGFLDEARGDQSVAEFDVVVGSLSASEVYVEGLEPSLPVETLGDRMEKCSLATALRGSEADIAFGIDEPLDFCPGDAVEGVDAVVHRASVWAGCVESPGHGSPCEARGARKSSGAKQRILVRPAILYCWRKAAN